MNTFWSLMATLFGALAFVGALGKAQATVVTLLLAQDAPASSAEEFVELVNGSPKVRSSLGEKWPHSSEQLRPRR